MESHDKTAAQPDGMPAGGECRADGVGLVSHTRRRLMVGGAGGLLALVAQALPGHAAWGATPADAARPGTASLDPLRRPAPRRSHPERALLTCVARAGKRVIAAGEAGIVVLSDDHGRTWRQARVPVSVTLTSLSFAAPDTGWAAGNGGVVLRTDDGGETWSLQLDGRRAAQLALEEARAGTDGAALADSLPKAARQRVATAHQWIADGPDKPLLDVHFFNVNDGIAVGAYGMALATRDGGRHWHSIAGRIENPGGRHLYRILATGDALYLAGEQGLILRSGSDVHQARFSALPSPYAGTFFDAISMGQHGIVMLGLRGHGFATQDGGATWHPLAVKGVVTLTTGLWLASDGSPAGQLVIADEAGQLRHSSDGGMSFQVLANPEPFPLSDLVASADGALIVAGARGVRRVVLTGAASVGAARVDRSRLVAGSHAGTHSAFQESHS